jgi:CheY-like chemotaxis protein
MQTLLVIEDSTEDFVALKRAFRETALKDKFVRCEDGEEALDYLFQQHTTSGKKLPDFILLDLNLPGTDGKEVLKAIKSQEMYRRIPVVVFTTSSNQEDVDECYELGANSYMVKPMAFDDLRKKAHVLEEYWLKNSRLPFQIH